MAAPVFKRIAEQVLPYLNVPHDIPVSPARLRAARRSQNSESDDVSDFDSVQVTSATFGDSGQTEPISAAMLPVSTSAPTVELAAGGDVSVPDLAGRTVRQVTEICIRLGVNPVLVGAGTVQEQAPPPGAMVRRGASVIFQFGRPVLRQAQLRAQGQLRKAAAR